jgi:hypothetical protein
MAMFKAFKPSGMEKIARAMGYQGNMQGFQDYLAQDPMKQQQMQTYQQKAMQMAKGGVVKMQQGGIMQAPGSIPQNTFTPRGGGNEEVNPFRRGQFAPIPGSEVGQPLNLSGIDTSLRQPSLQPAVGTVAPGAPNVTSGRYIDPRGLPDAVRIQPRTQPAANTGSVAQGVSNFTPAVNVGGLQAQRPFDLSSYTPEFIPDTSKVKPEDQLRREYEQARANAKAQRDAGFMGRIMLPGEMSYENWKQGNQYELMRNPNFMPPDLDPNRPFTGQPPVDLNTTGTTQIVQPPVPTASTDPQTQLPQQAVPTFTMPEPTTTTTTQYQTEDGTVYASEADVPEGVTTTPIEVTETKQPQIGDIMAQQAFTPGLPTGGAVAPVGTVATPDQMVDPTTGQVTGTMAVPTAMATTAQATAPQEAQAAQIQASTAAPAVASALDATQAAQGTVDPRAEVVAAQQTASSVGNVSAAQGNATLIDNPVQREIQAGELISGSADAQKAAQFTEQIQAAQATPSDQATVQGQLANLTANFDAKNPPAWAAGALRNATAQMAARGLGASSLAGQAIVQATLEAALPIAQADASVTAQFEAQNLTNRQQRAMLAAQQRAEFMGMEFTQDFQARVQNAARISDIANMNFTAEQQVQLENSRIANTMNLQNLSNSQAMVMAEAAALAQLDMANLNNRQQAAVQNAQSFLNMDMANLSNRQQTTMFKAQQRIQSLFTDQAAENAARQFNATSENQTNQFFANLSSQVSQFNAAQSNAQSQFNAGQRNTVERFNAELNNQRDQFNAQNQLVIAQSNAQWRREIATANTAAINRANELNATAALNISKQAYDNLWTYYADTMEWAWTSAENELDRINSMAIAQLSADAQAAATKAANKTAAGSAIGGLIGTLGSAFIEFCWVAREVYGPTDIRWFIFRDWMKHKAPRWLYKLYVKHGKDFAEYIKDKPKIKFVLKQMMNLVVKKPKTRYNYA